LGSCAQTAGCDGTWSAVYFGSAWSGSCKVTGLLPFAPLKNSAFFLSV
jgi:hypothetical protein